MVVDIETSKDFISEMFTVYCKKSLVHRIEIMSFISSTLFRETKCQEERVKEKKKGLIEDDGITLLRLPPPLFPLRKGEGELFN